MEQKWTHTHKPLGLNNCTSLYFPYIVFYTAVTLNAKIFLYKYPKKWLLEYKAIRDIASSFFYARKPPATVVETLF